tara:strand:+ start:16127 stop:16927 length:801 start_codon:yes stop_codon:yes gene_type:complete
MRNLLDFINKYNHLLLFIFLESFALFLIFQNSQFHKAAFLNSTNSVSANSFSIISNIKEYFSLKETNNLLLIENAKLKSLISYQNIDNISSSDPFQYISATIINNSVAKANNYLTLDKGKIDGIKKGMGVISERGVIGIVKETSKRYSMVLSILHSQSKLSVAIKKNNHFGSLQWDGISYKKARIYDIPSHVKLNIGDTIVTSGFSHIFPSKIDVGIISEINTQNDDKFHNIKMTFIEDFKQLRYVNVCESINKNEKIYIEKSLDE